MKTDPLRILVLFPMYGGSLPIGRYCARALQDLGHQVRIFDAPLFYSAFRGVSALGLSTQRTQALENLFLNVVSQAIWEEAQEFEPVFLLALAQAPVNRQLLQRLRKSGIRTAMWFVEDFRIFTYWKIYAPLYDIFAVIQKEPFQSELRAIGQKHVLYLPLAALPAFHRKLELSESEKREFGSEISFLGAGYPNRRRAFRSLAGENFKIWGSDWEGEGILASNIQRDGARISEEDSVRIYNASDINLNLHSSLQADTPISHGDFVNPRTFELAAMGAFQLVDRRQLMPELFAEDELATFSSMKEFNNALNFYRAHPEARAEMAARAQNRVLKEHTYQQRMKTLLDYAVKALGPWPNASDPIPGPDSEVTLQLEELKSSLGLGPLATFETVLGALRKKNGALTSFEAGLLFLDEWRKQYGHSKSA